MKFTLTADCRPDVDPKVHAKVLQALLHDAVMYGNDYGICAPIEVKPARERATHVPTDSK